MENNIIIISGATATGKTSTSIKIAKSLPHYKLEIVNFDSLLFYNELNIGSAKPSEKELSSVAHHLVNISSITKELNANDFIALAKEKIEHLHAKGVIPILVGGSTFYLRALIKGMYDSTTIPKELRDESNQKLKEKGINYFLTYLNEYDPESLRTIHENDHYRIIRAYEHYRLTGKPISEEKKKSDENDPYDFSKNQFPHAKITHINLFIDKEEHWNIILKRTEQMIEDGLVKEVENLLSNGYTGEEKPLQSIGYKETLDYINNKIETLDELKEKIFISTRKLAKSQKTFLKKVSPKLSFHPINDQDKILEYISQSLN